MSTYVVLLRSADDATYQKYLAVLAACQIAGVAPPKQVDAYFGDEGGLEAPLEVPYEARKWSDGDMQEGLEVDVDRLPAGVKTIRFINSW